MTHETELARLAELNAKLIGLLSYAVKKADDLHQAAYQENLSHVDPVMADAKCLVNLYAEAQHQAFLETR